MGTMSVINGRSCTRSQSALPEDWNISTLDCPKPVVIHGNLMSKNILLDRNLIPYLSDCCLHLLLNPSTGQEMLEAAAAQGYKAPELVKMRDCNEETDVYSLGVILLEILTGKEPVNEKPSAPGEDYYLSNTMRNAILDHRISDLFHPGGASFSANAVMGAVSARRKSSNFFNLPWLAVRLPQLSDPVPEK